MAFYDEQGRSDGEDFRTRVALGDISPNQVMPQAVRSRVKIATNYQNSANYSLATPQTDWSNVDTTNLSWDVQLSGDPLLLALTCLLYTDAQDIRVSMSIDGVEVTTGLGMIYLGALATAQTKHAMWIVTKPNTGLRRVRVVWWVGGAAGGALMFGAPSGAFVSAYAQEL